MAEILKITKNIRARLIALSNGVAVQTFDIYGRGRRTTYKDRRDELRAALKMAGIFEGVVFYNDAPRGGIAGEKCKVSAQNAATLREFLNKEEA